jgi:ADP-ribosylglycohydrolase
MALHCVYYSKSSKEALLKVINMGGDADTVAAITGQISGSIFGLDKEILSYYDYVRRY